MWFIRLNVLCAKKGGESSIYIGETGQYLSECIKEHMRPVDTNKQDESIISITGGHSVIKHGLHPEIDNWRFDTLQKEEGTCRRKLLEALMISKNKLDLNRDSGVRILIDNVKF